MNTLTIENKKYVVLSQKEYNDLRTKAVSKTVPAKRLSLKEGKKLAYKLIDKWANEKLAGEVSIVDIFTGTWEMTKGD